MRGYSKTILVGNLTRDPETRTTPSGLTICKFSIAVNRVYKDRDGNQKEEVSFIDCDSFGAPAETISRYTSKGSAMLVEGRLRQDTWETDGQKRSKLVVVVEQFQFIGYGDSQSSGGKGGGNDYESSAPARRQPSRSGSESGAAAAPGGEEFDDEVPF